MRFYLAGTHVKRSNEECAADWAASPEGCLKCSPIKREQRNTIKLLKDRNDCLHDDNILLKRKLSRLSPKHVNRLQIQVAMLEHEIRNDKDHISRLLSALRTKKIPEPQGPWGSEGVFYVIQLAPEMPSRLKLGWARWAERRLKDFHVTSPTGVLLAYWPCDRSQEIPTIRKLTTPKQRVDPRETCEVYDVPNVQELLTNAAALFANGAGNYSPDQAVAAAIERQEVHA